MTRSRTNPPARATLARRALAPALALSLVVLMPTTAQAGPKDRESEARTGVARLAEHTHHVGAPYPKKLTRKKLRKKYYYDLSPKLTINKYKRLRGGEAFRVCLRHKGGGWATWHSAKGKIRSSGKGKACRF